MTIVMGKQLPYTNLCINNLLLPDQALGKPDFSCVVVDAVSMLRQVLQALLRGELPATVLAVDPGALDDEMLWRRIIRAFPNLTSLPQLAVRVALVDETGDVLAWPVVQNGRRSGSG